MKPAILAAAGALFAATLTSCDALEIEAGQVPLGWRAPSEAQIRVMERGEVMDLLRLRGFGAAFQEERRVAVLRLAELDSWPSDLVDVVVSRHIRLGMTMDQVIAAWGNPRDVDRHTNAWGTIEWWWYAGPSLVRFGSNGLVESIGT